MDFKKLNETAMNNARRTLVEHFDPNAFLVYSTALQNLQGMDIEGTGVDDSIKNIFSSFLAYYKKARSGQNATDELSAMLADVRKMLIELYYQVGDDGKNEMKRTCEKILKL